MDYKVLREIGLTESEIKVYLALLKLGSTTSGPLTEKSKVARSKIYEILERLISKSLVSYIIKQKTKYYQAEDPVKIQEYLDQKEKDFKQQRNKINKLIPQLQLEKQLSKKTSEAQIYSGFRGIQTVHEHMYHKLKRGNDFFYLGIPSSQKKEHHWYWQRDHKRREKAGLISRALFNKNTDRKILKNRNSYKHSEARYMPFPVKTPAWIMGYKDVTVIGLQSNDGMAIEIINQEIADSFREYFEAFWKLSKPFK
jgi:sugar-specific transcriptional regulator TrmB